MVRGVVAHRDGPNIVQLVAVKPPVANEAFSKLFVVRLHSRYRRAERRQIACHNRGLAVFVEHQPVRVFFHNVGNAEFLSSVAMLSVFYSQWQPPELQLDSLLVKFANHVWNSIAGKSRGAWLPITVIAKPAIVERGPVNPQFFQLGDSVEHLL